MFACVCVRTCVGVCICIQLVPDFVWFDLMIFQLYEWCKSETHSVEAVLRILIFSLGW